MIEDISVQSLAQDAYDFIQLCAPVASLSAPHIYLSALSFVPPTSTVFRLYSPHFPRVLKVIDTASILRTTSAVRNTIRYPGINRIAVSPDGSLIAVATNHDIIMFNFHTGERVSDILRAHEDSIYDLQFSADTTRLASFSDDETIRLWDVRTGKAAGEPLRGHTGGVGSIAWRRDGQHLVSGSRDGTVRAWDASAGTQIWCVNIGNWVWSVAYSPDGALVAVAGESGVITLWHSIDGSSAGVLSGHMGWVRSVVFSPDGTRLASGSYDESIRLWDVETRWPVGEPLKGHTDDVWTVAFSPDGTRLASVSDDWTLRLWDLSATGPISGRVLGSTYSRSVAFSRDGAHVVTDSDDSVTIWDAGWCSTGDTEVMSAHYTDWVRCLASSPLGSRIVSGSDDNIVQIWDSTTGRAIGQPAGHPHYVTAVAISPDGALIVSGAGKTLYVWDMDTSHRIGDPLEGHKSTVEAICFSDDGKQILSCSCLELLIWDVDSHALCADGASTWEGRFDLFAFGPDGKSLAGYRHASNEVLVWDIVLQKQRSPLWIVESSQSITISPDGSQIVLGHQSGKVSVWDMSGKQLKQLEGHQDLVRAVAFSPDGTHVASGSNDWTIRVTNVESGQILGHPIRCGYEVISLTFTADCTRLASSLYDGSIQIWDVSPQTLESGTVTFTLILKLSHCRLHCRLCGMPHLLGQCCSCHAIAQYALRTELPS